MAQTEAIMDMKEMYLQARENEFQTTLKVLKAYPHDRGEYKPHEKSKSARELAWLFGSEELALPQLLEGKGFPKDWPEAPATYAETLKEVERIHKEATEKLRAMSQEELDGMVPFPIAPKKMGEVPKMQLLWMFLMDQIHHRGQMSVYIRLAGGKVPSIYGPTADEPWM